MDWHIVTNPADSELDRLAERYHLHPLHIEDCRHHNQNAKIEEGEGYLFTVLKVIRILPDGTLHAADLDLFLGSNYLITVEEEDCPEIRGIIETVQKGPAPNARPDQVYHRVIDHVVDAYLPVLDRYDDLIDDLEDDALQSSEPQTLSRIFEAKRALILLRRVFVNTRDVAAHLQRSESPFIHHDLWPFLRDVYDHVARNLDVVEMQRDLLSGALDVYLSSVANRTNQVMKVLTILGTIALPALVVSGFYGMNVKGLPGADAQHGMYIALALMVASTAVLLYILRRFHWF